MKETGNITKTLNSDFSVLTEENRKSAIEMIKFLVITQNTVIPELLHLDKNKITEKETLNNEK
jgi:hypothetical protein